MSYHKEPGDYISMGTRLASRSSVMMLRESKSLLALHEPSATFMTNVELMKAIDEATVANRTYFLENEIFENYLTRMEPELLVGLQQVIEQTIAKQNRMNAVASAWFRPQSLYSSMSLANLSQRGSHVSLVTRETHHSVRSGGASVFDGPKLNITHKIEMVSREIEETRRLLENLLRQSKIDRANLLANIEQLKSLREYVQESKDEFKRKIIIGAKEDITQRIPAEKYERFLEEWLTKADFEIGKLRLKTNTLKSVNRKCKKLLQQKIELGESLRPVDFAQMKIDNEKLAKTLEDSNRYLEELKIISSKSNLKVTNFKDELFRQETQLKKLNYAINDVTDQIKKSWKRVELIENEIAVADNKLHHIQQLRSNYTVPDVYEYLKVKSDISRLKQDIKTWTRRTSIQHASLVTSQRQLQKLLAKATPARKNPIKMVKEFRLLPSLPPGEVEVTVAVQNF